ncbi:MAG: TRAP transporter large permease subunit [Deltaproteobacteria bacterium]|nr:TRAP transporter large permease subunit [Deltaproteobacteria bacterium]
MLERFAAGIDRFLVPASRLVNGMGSATLLGMVLLMAVHVILRYALGMPIKGTVELEEFMLVMVVFPGLAYTAVQKRHVRIDFIVERLPEKTRSLVNSLTAAISVGICFVMVWRGAVYARNSWAHKDASVLLHIPAYLFISVAVIGSLLLLIALISELSRSLSKVISAGKSWAALFILIFTGFLGSVYLLYLSEPAPNTVALMAMGALLLMLAFRMYIAFAMMLVGFVGMSVISGVNAGYHLVGTVPYEMTAEYHLCVIPFFVLMGHLCAVAGISRDIYSTAYKWLGHLRGGLSMGTVGGCAGFAAVSGDSMGTAAVMGTVALPEMKHYKYDDSLATGCVAAGGTLGILIPPSMGFIVYAIITETSISKLFMAGIFPGLLLALLFMFVIYIQTRLKPDMAPAAPRTGWAEKLVSLKDTWAMILIFLLVIGGIYRGVFTPTEAGAIGASGALIIGIMNRQLTRKKLLKALVDTGRTVSMLFLLLIGAHILGYFLAGSEAPHHVAEFISGLPFPRYFLLTIILFIYLLLGCVMNILPAVIVTLPIFYPAVLALGFDPIWFGVILVIVMEMGLITPPVGMNVFVIKGVAKDVDIGTIYRGVLPFLLAMIVCIILLTFFPSIVLYLPLAIK